MRIFFSWGRGWFKAGLLGSTSARRSAGSLVQQATTIGSFSLLLLFRSGLGCWCSRSSPSQSSFMRIGVPRVCCYIRVWNGTKFPHYCWCHKPHDQWYGTWTQTAFPEQFRNGTLRLPPSYWGSLRSKSWLSNFSRWAWPDRQSYSRYLLNK